jgi:dCMP deaminase
MATAAPERPSKTEYYLRIAEEVSRRGTCYRVNIGTIIVRDDQIIATGYVGAPRKTRDCHEHGSCLRDKLDIPHGHRYELCRSVHSEQNSIVNAARAGVSLLGGDMYVYAESLEDGKLIDAVPCFICKKMIVNAGIDRVISSMSDRSVKVFAVAAWIDQWQSYDILDDKHQYGKDVNSRNGKGS